MSYCDDCILVDICGCESYYDESLKFCADKHRYILKSELKNIRAEIENINVLAYTRFQEKHFLSPVEIKKAALKIIDKYIEETTNSEH